MDGSIDFIHILCKINPAGTVKTILALWILESTNAAQISEDSTLAPDLPPGLFVAALLSLGILSLMWNLARWLLAIIVILYTIIIFGVGIQMSLKHRTVFKCHWSPTGDCHNPSFLGYCILVGINR